MWPDKSKTSVTEQGGLIVRVAPFVASGFDFVGGSITLVPNGTWYVGVEIFSKQIRALPRLGHRGWVPVAKVVTSATKVTSIDQITPALPASRIPRTLKKVLSGQNINVVIMGSSLTQSDGGATTWPGMVFGGGSTNKYKLPTPVSCQYAGVGASPNQYQLAMLGFASAHSAYGYSNAGFASAMLGDKTPPNGRSTLFRGVDLVVIGCLANGGDYRIECIEPIVRQLRKMGVEVLMVTDNPQGPSTNYATMSTASLYVDAPEVFRVADLYGVEVADTAAYVFEAHIRAGGVGIYGDTIHMASGAPNGPAASTPANGHEVWARAVRSIFSVGVSVSPATVTNYSYDFGSSTQGWAVFSNATVSQSGGVLQVSKNTSASGQWGTWITLPQMLQAGDTIDYTATVTYSGFVPSFGTQGGGWASNTINAAASGTVSTGRLTMTKATNQLLLFANYDAAPLNTLMTLDNVSLVVNAAGVTTNYDAAPSRALECKALPPVRVVTDMKTPADAYVILPPDEFFTVNNNPAKGVLQAHPWGGSSFARRFSTNVGASADLLGLAAGKKAVMAADCYVAQYLVHYRDVADGACQFKVNVNGNTVKTINISAPPFGNEWWTSIYTPTEANVNNPLIQGALEIEVVSGTLKIAALVSLTADVTYLTPEQITYVGAGWLPKETSRSGLPGRPTDTVGNQATVYCPGLRLAWIISGNPGSKMWNAYSGQNWVSNQNPGGNYHVYLAAGLVGSGAVHTIKCVEANASGSQADGHALHVGGAIVINDR